MSINHDKIFSLFMESVSGTISPGDADLVNKELATNPEFAAAWATFMQEGDRLNLSGFVDRLDAEAGLADLKAMSSTPVKGRLRTLSFSRIAAVAAVFLLVASSIAYLAFFRTREITDKNAIAAIVSRNKENIVLHLGNGKTIDINKHGGGQQMLLGRSQLSIGDSSLHFTSMDTSTNTIFIPAGENYQVVLSDGTEITLNSETRLRFPFNFSGATRDVYLDGEAYFNVAKDAKHPFIVHTPLTQVQVLGTMFNVNTYNPASVNTSLVEGSVKTNSPGGPEILLTPGFTASYDREKGFAKQPFDEEEVLSWINGVYYFHNIAVTDLSDLISRCYGVSVSMNKNELKKKFVTGSMDKTNLPEFLKDLEAIAGIKYYYSGKQLFLK